VALQGTYANGELSHFYNGRPVLRVPGPVARFFSLGVILVILFSAFSAAREKEKRAPHSFTSPTGGTYATSGSSHCFRCLRLWENNACCLCDWPLGEVVELRRSLLLLSLAAKKVVKSIIELSIKIPFYP
jgi:hypothetical protein